LQKTQRKKAASPNLFNSSSLKLVKRLAEYFL